MELANLAAVHNFFVRFLLFTAYFISPLVVLHIHSGTSKFLEVNLWPTTSTDLTYLAHQIKFVTLVLLFVSVYVI